VIRSRPETKYARSGDVYIAYRVIGEGPTIDAGGLLPYTRKKILKQPRGGKILE
jgi:hypothetical protein